MLQVTELPIQTCSVACGHFEMVPSAGHFTLVSGRGEAERTYTEAWTGSQFTLISPSPVTGTWWPRSSERGRQYAGRPTSEASLVLFSFKMINNILRVHHGVIKDLQKAVTLGREQLIIRWMKIDQSLFFPQLTLWWPVWCAWKYAHSYLRISIHFSPIIILILMPRLIGGYLEHLLFCLFLFLHHSNRTMNPKCSISLFVLIWHPVCKTKFLI